MGIVSLRERDIQCRASRLSSTDVAAGCRECSAFKEKALALESSAPLLYIHTHGIMTAVDRLFEPFETTHIAGLGRGGSSMGNPLEDRGEDADVALDT
jgi:hypothetical protein